MAIPSISHTPGNPNQLHPNKFIVSFTALPNIEYWCQTVNVPGLALGEAYRATPYVDIYSPGDKLVFSPFSMSFIVDEDLKGWMEVYTWMIGLGFPTKFEEYQNLSKRLSAWAVPKPQFSDAMLVIFDSKQNPNIRVKMTNCFPTSLTDIMMSSTTSPETPLTADVVFRYDFYTIEVLAH